MLTVQEKVQRDIQQDLEEGIAVGRVIREMTKEEQEENQKEIYSIIRGICSEYQGEFRVRLDYGNTIVFSRNIDKFADFSLKFIIDRIYPKSIVWGRLKIFSYSDSKDLKNLNQNKEFNQVIDFMSKVESKLSILEF